LMLPERSVELHDKPFGGEFDEQRTSA